MTCLVELCAGAAGASLRVLSSRLGPPVAWMGGKRRLAPDILGAIGVVPSEVTRIVWVDASTWGWVWPVLLGDEGPDVCATLRTWGEAESARELWDRLVAIGPASWHSDAQRAAQWLWLQARSASGVPVWWGEARHGGGCRKGDGERQADDRGEDRRWPYHDGERGGWRQGSANGRPDQPAGQRNSWLASDGRGVPRAAGYKGERKYQGRSGGILYPATVARRIEAIRDAAARWGGTIEVHHARVEDVEPIPGAKVVFDPPYLGRTGYGADCPRDLVLKVARRWGEVATVAVCEAEPLDLDGWHHLELAAGQKSAEWLTLSRPAARRPAVQAPLFAPPT